MSIKSDAEIYKILEAHLKNSGETPLTSADLWAHADVSTNARSPEKVSDYLGLMWRRGLIQRWAVPKSSTSRARFAYTWKDEAKAEPVRIDHLTRITGHYKKANVTITEDDDKIILDFDKFTLTIQAKG